MSVIYHFEVASILLPYWTQPGTCLLLLSELNTPSMQHLCSYLTSYEKYDFTHMKGITTS